MYLVGINKKKKKNKKKTKKRKREREKKRRMTQIDSRDSCWQKSSALLYIYISFSPPFNIPRAKRNRFTKIIRADGE